MEKLAAKERTVSLCGREVIVTGSAEGTATTKEHGGGRDVRRLKRAGRERSIDWNPGIRVALHPVIQLLVHDRGQGTLSGGHMMFQAGQLGHGRHEARILTLHHHLLSHTY